MAEYIESEFNPCDVCGYKKCSNCVLHELAMKVVRHPAADIAPVVHGWWINKTNPSRAIVEQRVDCSACGHIFWHTSALSYNYCPNCGAKMDAESSLP